VKFSSNFQPAVKQRDVKDSDEFIVRELIREKQIRAVKIGQWRVRPEDLDEFIKSRSNL